MNEAELERLVWERLDRTISAEDSARLDAALAGDSAARARFETIQEVARGLSGVAPVPSPPELRPRIDRALATSSPRWRRRAVPVVRWWPRLAYLAAGLLVGAVAARLLLPAPALDREMASGTMIVASDRPAAAISIDLGGDCTVALWRSGNLLNLELAVRAARPLEVTLQAQRGSMGIERVTLSGGAEWEASADGGVVRIRAEGPGRGGVEVSQPGEEAGILVRVTSAGVVLAEREVRFEELDAGG